MSQLIRHIQAAADTVKDAAQISGILRKHPNIAKQEKAKSAKGKASAGHASAASARGPGPYSRF